VRFPLAVKCDSLDSDSGNPWRWGGTFSKGEFQLAWNFCHFGESGVTTETVVDFIPDFERTVEAILGASDTVEQFAVYDWLFCPPREMNVG
jgi:hypothetical protein